MCRKCVCINTRILSCPTDILKTTPFTQTALITRPTDTYDPRCIMSGHPSREKYTLFTALRIQLRLNESSS